MNDLEDCIDKLLISFEEMVKLRKKFRGSLHEMKDADIDKKKRILKKVAALIVKIFDLEDSIDKLLISFEEMVKLRKKFRGSLHEMKDADIDNKKRILKKIAALKVEIIYYGMQQSILKEPRLLKQLRLLKKGKYKN